MPSIEKGRFLDHMKCAIPVTLGWYRLWFSSVESRDWVAAEQYLILSAPVLLLHGQYKISYLNEHNSTFQRLIFFTFALCSLLNINVTDLWSLINFKWFPNKYGLHFFNTTTMDFSIEEWVYLLGESVLEKKTISHSFWLRVAPITSDASVSTPRMQF